MDRDFFISLCLATHKVGNLLNTQVGTPIKLCANAVLSRLVLLFEGSLSSIQKKSFAEDVLKELQSLAKHFELAKAQGSINPANFSILEGEYAKVRQFAQGFVNGMSEAPLRTTSVRESGTGKSLRARKILGLLDAKGKAQVWELQKILPQVTKRTLRRDLDTLVKQGALERKGEWNTVYYQLSNR